VFDVGTWTCVPWEPPLASGPTFKNPPVGEVALSVQHEPLARLTPPKVARYWERVREAFPNWSTHPPINAAFETFGLPTVRRARLSFEVANAPGPTRAMFEDDDGDHLMQLQPDRFVRNWRRFKNQDAEYPRYATVHRPEFKTAVQDYLQFLAEWEIGDLMPNQVEVTYVNHVEPEGVWQRHGQLAAVLAVLSGQHSDAHLAEPEAIDVNLRYIIPGDDGDPVGRLHITVRPVYRARDLTPLFAINLTARVGISGGGVDDVLREMDRGHDFLVSAFRSITTAEMHKMWGLEDER